MFERFLAFSFHTPARCLVFAFSFLFIGHPLLGPSALFPVPTVRHECRRIVSTTWQSRARESIHSFDRGLSATGADQIFIGH